MKKAKQDDPYGKAFTFASFSNSERGRCSMKEYMSVMRARYERLKGAALVDKNGLLTAESPVQGEAWSDMLAKAPWYLVNANKHKPDLSTGIFLQLRSIVPTELNGVKKFRKFLQDVHTYGPELLPAMPI